MRTSVIDLKRLFIDQWIILCMGVLLLCSSIVFGPTNVLGAKQQLDITDKEVTRAVESTLLFDEYVPSHLIDVRTERGIVTLIGVMPNYRAKDRAAKLVETVKGVQSVINGLTVKVSNRTDEQIRDNVYKALQDDSATDAYKIDVAVEHGVVTLTGTVPSWAARELSEWVASGVYGVRDMKNRLLIHMKEQRADDVIVDEILKRLEADVWVNEDSVLITVDKGVVSLDGVVGSVAEKTASDQRRTRCRGQRGRRSSPVRQSLGQGEHATKGTARI